MEGAKASGSGYEGNRTYTSSAPDEGCSRNEGVSLPPHKPKPLHDRARQGHPRRSARSKVVQRARRGKEWTAGSRAACTHWFCWRRVPKQRDHWGRAWIGTGPGPSIELTPRGVRISTRTPVVVPGWGLQLTRMCYRRVLLAAAVIGHPELVNHLELHRGSFEISSATEQGVVSFAPAAGTSTVCVCQSLHPNGMAVFP
ncbi:hypothetical protein CONLIGDRAFT_275737 [Coniochaeta ligniaria NRRL 30616]|uniref:Uncharacterized protein n=1 Tax=Coniochaeta ligniaria NRRL 30616 TaxID=1408157 RepID=A0A1J7IZH8_9PEZI|nr:hypothetical protein CONLIGDRAFT_275737 [Coniochaeta ligniaria NRRL 30616]